MTSMSIALQNTVILTGFLNQFPGASSSLLAEAGLDDVLDGVLQGQQEVHVWSNRGCLPLTHSLVHPCSS